MYRDSLGDWIQMDKIKRYLNGVPIPAAFVLCSLGGLLAAFLLTRVTANLANRGMDSVAAKYEISLRSVPVEIVHGDYEEVSLQTFSGTLKPYSEETDGEADTPMHYYVLRLEPLDGQEGSQWAEVGTGEYEAVHEEPATVDYKVLNLNKMVYQEADRKRYDFFEGLANMAAVFWYSLSLCAAAVIFYCWKFRRPFRILDQAMQKIADNDLNCPIEYKGRDECGRLCATFERMRQELVRNHQKMWDSVEERKRLNGAFAHDLRTPLTVLRGNAELLYGMLAEDGAGEELLHSVTAISNQVSRLNAYVDTMSALQRLEDYEPCLRETAPSALEQIVSETAALLYPAGERKLICRWTGKELLVDREAFTQICENLLSNAARFARSRIEILLGDDFHDCEGDCESEGIDDSGGRHESKDCQESKRRCESAGYFLWLTVADDGCGFSEKDLKEAPLAYYRGTKSEEGEVPHFGLGLSICSLLAGKLGGKLLLENGSDGGARVTVKLDTIRGTL